jgi:hypothetical protein
MSLFLRKLQFQNNKKEKDKRKVKMMSDPLRKDMSLTFLLD